MVTGVRRGADNRAVTHGRLLGRIDAGGLCVPGDGASLRKLHELKHDACGRLEIVDDDDAGQRVGGLRKFLGMAHWVLCGGTDEREGKWEGVGERPSRDGEGVGVTAASCCD